MLAGNVSMRRCLEGLYPPVQDHPVLAPVTRKRVPTGPLLPSDSQQGPFFVRADLVQFVRVEGFLVPGSSFKSVYRGLRTFDAAVCRVMTNEALLLCLRASIADVRSRRTRPRQRVSGRRCLHIQAT
jgi:hypothetical protein